LSLYIFDLCAKKPNLAIDKLAIEFASDSKVDLTSRLEAKKIIDPRCITKHVNAFSANRFRRPSLAFDKD